jgi:hypothetical protein
MGVGTFELIICVIVGMNQPGVSGQILFVSKRECTVSNIYLAKFYLFSR